MHRFNISPEDISDRAYYPRVLLGEYFSAQFQQVIELHLAQGCEVSSYTSTSVTNVEPLGNTWRIETDIALGSVTTDIAVIATGHQFAPHPSLLDPHLHFAV